MENIQDLMFKYDMYDAGCQRPNCTCPRTGSSCEWFAGCEFKMPIGKYQVGDWVPMITWNSNTYVLSIFDWEDPETCEDYGEPEEFNLNISFEKK